GHCELRSDHDLWNPGQRSSDWTRRLGLLGQGLELLLSDARHVPLCVEIEARERRHALDNTQFNASVRAQTFGCVAGLRKKTGKCHCEAPGLRGGNQLLGIRAALFAKS